MARVLVTCFTPFGGESENTSQWVVEALAEATAEEDGVALLVLPAVYDRAAQGVIEALTPEVREIVMLGMGGTEACVRIEEQARNLDDSKTVDGAGVARSGDLIVADGPDMISPAYPRRELLQFLHRRGVAAVVSESAGAFVCNNTYYRVAMKLAEEGTENPPLCVFIHVPRPRGTRPGEGWTHECAGAFAQALLEWLRQQARFYV